MEDTSGFYKKQDDGTWVYAPNFVYAPKFTLERDGNRESNDGWEWHEAAPQEYIMFMLLSQLPNND